MVRFEDSSLPLVAQLRTSSRLFLLSVWQIIADLSGSSDFSKSDYFTSRLAWVIHLCVRRSDLTCRQNAHLVRSELVGGEWGLFCRFWSILVDFANFHPLDIQRLKETVLSIALIFIFFRQKPVVRLVRLPNSVFTLVDRRTY